MKLLSFHDSLCVVRKSCPSGEGRGGAAADLGHCPPPAIPTPPGGNSTTDVLNDDSPAAPGVSEPNCNANLNVLDKFSAKLRAHTSRSGVHMCRIAMSNHFRHMSAPQSARNSSRGVVRPNPTHTL